VDPAELQTRLEQALSVRRQFSTRIVALSTMRAGVPFRAEQMEYACWSAWMFNMDGMAWGEPDFATDSQLPERTCEFLRLSPAQLQARTDTATLDNLFWRTTTEGIVVLDIKNNTVNLRRGQFKLERYQLQSQSLLESRRGDAVRR
jgi:hypothetical protein